MRFFFKLIFQFVQPEMLDWNHGLLSQTPHVSLKNSHYVLQTIIENSKQASLLIVA